jgi:hypothetical protein
MSDLSNSASCLFPVWQLWAGSAVIPVHRRVVWQAAGSDRQFVAYLGILNSRATLTIRVEESGVLVVVVNSSESDGLSSLPRAMTWAEWVISDVLAGQQPKRARRGSKRSKIEDIAA